MVKYIEQLPSILEKYGIAKEDICIEGSSVLSVFGLRENNDLDISIKSVVRKNLIQQYKDELNILASGTICFNTNVQYCICRYDKVGISDDDIVSNSQYHFFYEGWKIVRVEIELATKIKKGREKDIADVKEAENLLKSYTDFDWALFRKCLSYSVQKITQAQISEKKNTNRTMDYLERKRNILKRIIKLILKVIREFFLSPKEFFLNIEQVINKQKIIVSNVLQIPINSELASITDFVISPATLLGMQFKNGVFNRYDIIMRYLTIEKLECELGAPPPPIIVDEYVKMQQDRGRRNMLNNFLILITEIKNNGFLTKYPLSIDLNANLINGSHRLACSLYFDIEKISYTIIQAGRNIQYGLDWFRGKNFDENTLIELENKKKALFLRKGIYFCATIWGTAKQFYNDITKDIDAQYNIVYQNDLFLGDRYGELIDDIYAIDDIDTWKVLTKKQLLFESPNEIRIILFEIPQPDFRIEKRNNSYLSSKGAALKKMIREKYRPFIHDYFYDVIIHTGDNYEHNAEMIKAISRHTTINVDKIK